ncbi:hypothetical protein MKR48_08440 [Staphylococcus haemolyticus]|uniref:hypothetical protein n=1 Tax=Staphylococcus haemolyticus TaxID=1283 RepID=UPI001F0B6FC1|nr:hypothetical protein [Staphylococcus haemolyticus]MCH4401729.1 hypothetical protein [Staphylococcus haemolyticus]
MNIFRAINRWVRPYMYDDEIVEPKKERKTTKKKVKVSKITKEDKKPTELDAVSRGELGVRIITLNEQLDEDSAFQRLDKSHSHIAYYFHSHNRHQIAVRFEPQSGFRYYKRNEQKRKSFKPLLYPMYQRFDKTHLIPVGFHGSESDPRLLIGWSSTLNRGGIKKHEDKVTNINQAHTIYWFVDVEKHRDSGGAYWTSTVWFEDGELLDKKKFYDKSKFHWPN